MTKLYGYEHSENMYYMCFTHVLQVYELHV